MKVSFNLWYFIRISKDKTETKNWKGVTIPDVYIRLQLLLIWCNSFHKILPSSVHSNKSYLLSDALLHPELDLNKLCPISKCNNYELIDHSNYFNCQSK